MAEIIETQKLPVTITKVKIGKKDLTKKLIDQLPSYLFVYHKRVDGVPCYGLPVIDTSEKNYLEHRLDLKTEYVVCGEIIGYVSVKNIFTKRDLDNTLSNNKIFTDIKGQYQRLINHSDDWKFIIFHHEGKLMKGLIDSWTIEQLGLEPEQIFI